MNRHSELALVLLVLALSTAYTEIVQFRPCNYPDTNAPSNCTIHEVRVDPCKEAAEGKPCKLKRGITGNITYEYTPEFAGDNLQGRVYWVSQVVDIPFLGLNSNACVSTSCPAVPGQRSTYHVGLAISKKYPVRMYDLKWRLWNEAEQECCFLIQVRITK